GSSRTRTARASTAARSAEVCLRMSTQYSSRSIIRAIPRTWPSMRLSRRISCALSFEYEWRNCSVLSSAGMACPSRGVADSAEDRRDDVEGDPDAAVPAEERAADPEDG